MCKLSLYKMNGYVWCNFFVHTSNKIWLKEFKEFLKYKILIMCMFNKPNYYIYVNWILVCNISNNDT
jgi:hypothetical protein